MNHRVLELLKAPKNIQSEDLDLLKEEINSFPYVQNIRALYLYGVNLYDKANYQKVLSTTAAYTTDKKILYQLINGKIQQRPKPDVQPEIKKEKKIPAENPLTLLQKAKSSNFPIKREEAQSIEVQPEILEQPKQDTVDLKEETCVLPTPQEEVKHVYVNGERNRILFEGEENFLNDDLAETIDLESTLESGSIVTQKAEKKETLPDNKESLQEEPAVEDSKITDTEIEEPLSENNIEEENTIPESEIQVLDQTDFTPEKIINKDEISLEKEEEIVENDSQLSFHEVEPLLSEVEVQENERAEKVEEEELIAKESNHLIEEETAGFTPEKIINKDEISQEKEEEIIEDDSQLSFHEIEPLLSEVEIQKSETTEEGEEKETIAEESENLNEEETAEFTPEKIINEDEISSEKEKNAVQDEAELSFHGTESFLPEVKIQTNNSEDAIAEVAQQNINKHENEMRRLIEEVEKKMKEKAASEAIKKEEEPENIGNDISFAETQSFEVKSSEVENQQEIREEKTPSETIDEIKESEVLETTETISEWKPMSFESHLPDSMLDKPAVVEPKDEEETVEETVVASPEDVAVEISKEIQADEIIEEAEEETKEEVPAMNVSFFGTDISKWNATESESDKKEETPREEIPEIVTENKNPIPLDSNVPGFINTWQSWLKIDRTEEVEKEKEEIKTKAIEAFIENNPRISQLKDESSYVVKERNDDISHLMTETLANLYFEQKLYSKAIKAFQILIEKTPEKKEYYENRIQEIKDFRTKG